MLTVEFANRINLFVHHLQDYLNNTLDPPPQVRVSQKGRTKRRVYLEWGGDTPDQAYCFIRIGDGAVLKATSWRTCVYANPICSHIYDEDYGVSTCTAQGVCYPGVPSNHPEINKLLHSRA